MCSFCGRPGQVACSAGDAWCDAVVTSAFSRESSWTKTVPSSRWPRRPFRSEPRCSKATSAAARPDGTATCLNEVGDSRHFLRLQRPDAIGTGCSRSQPEDLGGSLAAIPQGIAFWSRSSLFPLFPLVHGKAAICHARGFGTILGVPHRERLPFFAFCIRAEEAR